MVEKNIRKDYLSECLEFNHRSTSNEYVDTKIVSRKKTWDQNV